MGQLYEHRQLPLSGIIHQAEFGSLNVAGSFKIDGQVFIKLPKGATHRGIQVNAALVTGKGYRFFRDEMLVLWLGE